MEPRSDEPGPGLSRDELRSWARERRTDHEADSKSIGDAVASWLAGPNRRPGWVVVYDSMPGEIDLSPLLASGLGPFATTRTPDDGWDLTIHPWDSQRELHRYGYSQPVADAEVVPDEQVSAVLVPALVFDYRGHRLGWGAGYYDRFLARLGSGATRIGISDGAIVRSLPVEPHDIPMDLLVTEAGLNELPLSAWPPGGLAVS